MARLTRYDISGHPQHVIQRGNNRCVTFVADEDYVIYLDCLAEAAARAACAVHGYVLMTNHVHLLVTPATADGLGRMMQALGRRYVRYFNHTQGRSGTLWEGRYRATVVDGDHYLLACLRYIDLNPVRAGMVADPGDYPWSSHRALAAGQPSPLVTPHPRYLALGATPAERQAAYRALFASPAEAAELAAIRESTHKAWVLGSDRFKDEIARLTERRVAPAPRGRPRKEAHDVA